MGEIVPVLTGMRRTTIIDVAREAGVSTKTVSRVFNDEPNVTEAVRKRVREAAEALNYHPNVLAQALVRRRSHLIGLVYENPSPSYVVELQMGVLERLKDERYRLVVIPVASVAERSARSSACCAPPPWTAWSWRRRPRTTAASCRI